MRQLSELKKRKRELGYTNLEVARQSGVPLGTVQKIFAGVTKSPRIDSMAAIERILFPELSPGFDAPVEGKERADAGQGEVSNGKEEGISQKERTPGTYPVHTQTGQIREQEAVYGTSAVLKRRNKTDGEFTYGDYLALPDERRVELIDGSFYDMGAPNNRHQIIVGQLYSMFVNCVKDHPECMALLSPLDVMLDNDEKTTLQPDLMVLCDLSKMKKGRVFGAPDLVVEVISPGSRKMDLGLKVTKYMKAGVREYWALDYERGKVIVYEMEKDMDVTLYPFDGEIPVGISGGRCRIPVGEIAKLLKRLGEI
ncbi:MAG: Uma2 family endonuclease [Lachnospiraceae bacterium]|nr:Uma2 family endonuclease [Lachnospiraceae bacterium]